MQVLVEDPISSPLAMYLHGRFSDWLNAAEPQYQIYEENFRDREMIPEDGDTSGSGVPKATKGRQIVIGSTRNKIRSGTALTADSMRSSARYPYDIESGIKRLAPHAFALKKILDRVMDEMGMWTLLDKVNLSAGTYGDGFLVGPFLVERTFEKPVDVEFANVGGQIKPIPKFERIKTLFPQFRYGANLDIIPDPAASDTNGPLRGTGFFWRQLLQPEQIVALAGETDDQGKPLYRNLEHVIRLAATGETGVQGNERLKQLRANTNYYPPTGQIAHHVFCGLVPVGALAAWFGLTSAADIRRDFKIDPADKLTHRVEAIVDMMGGIPVRAQINHWHQERRILARFPWERVEDQFYSRGIAINNAAPQKIQTAAVRMWIESKSLALLAPIVYNPDMFLPGQSFKFTPNKALKLKPWVRNAEMAKAAFSKLEIPDVSGGWEMFYELGEKLSDIGTGQNQYMQGNPQASHLNPTATGVSLLMGAAQSPMKSVMMNFDQFMRDVMNGLVDCVIKHLDPRIVALWFGSDPVRDTVSEQNPEGFSIAELFQQLQAAGTVSMLSIKATGLQTFERKSIVFQKIAMLWSLFNQSPAAQQIILGADMARIMWDFADLGVEAPMRTQEQLDQLLNMAEQARQQELLEARKLKAADAQTKLAERQIDAQGKIAVAEINAEAKVKTAKKAKAHS